MTDHHHAPGSRHSDHSAIGVHGMLLFGQNPLYLSHLPMFMRPHNF
jgi:hypothetical protein